MRQLREVLRIPARIFLALDTILWYRIRHHRTMPAASRSLRRFRISMRACQPSGMCGRKVGLPVPEDLGSSLGPVTRVAGRCRHRQIPTGWPSRWWACRFPKIRYWPSAASFKRGPTGTSAARQACSASSYPHRPAAPDAGTSASRRLYILMELNGSGESGNRANTLSDDPVFRTLSERTASFGPFKIDEHEGQSPWHSAA